MSEANNEFSYKDSISLKEHFRCIMEEAVKANNQRIKDVEEEVNIKFDARDKALELQSKVYNQRIDSLNEWRAQNKDERDSYLTRIEYEAKHQLLENKMESMQKIIWLALGALIVIDYIIKFLK